MLLITSRSLRKMSFGDMRRGENPPILELLFWCMLSSLSLSLSTVEETMEDESSVKKGVKLVCRSRGGMMDGSIG